MKFGLLGAAVVLSFALAWPAVATPVAVHHVKNVACDPRDPGNPFSERYDYQTWSA